MKIKATLCVIAFCLCAINLQAQNLFKKYQPNKETTAFSIKHELPSNVKYYTFDYDALASQLRTIPQRGESSNINKVKLILPNSEVGEY